MKTSKQTGMTLVELVIVLIVLGIFGSISASKISSSSSLTIGQQASQFANQIRHAQSLAQTWGCQLSVVVTNTTNYEVRNKTPVTGKTQCSATNTVVTDPATGQNFSHALEYGVQFSATGIFDFNLKGVPLDNATDLQLNSATTFTMTGGGSTYTISISDITGFVSITGP